MEETRYAVKKGEHTEYRDIESLHKLIDELLTRVEEERRIGKPAQLSIQIVHPETRVIEQKVDEIAGIKPDEFIRGLEIKEKRRKALEKARMVREQKRRKEEQLRKRRMTILKKARAARMAKIKLVKAKKKSGAK